MGEIALSSSKAWKGRIFYSVSSQDVAGNYSQVYIYAGMWKTDGYFTSSNSYTSGTITINGTSYDLTGYQQFKDEVCIFEATVTIPHNSDGSKSFTISLSCKGQASTSLSGVTLSGSGTVTLPIIPRSSSISVNSGTLGTPQTITANSKSSSFTHTLTWSSNGESGTIANKSSATSWNFTPPLRLAEYAPNGVSVSMKFTLTTYNGSTAVGSDSKTVAMTIPSSVVPSVSIDVSDGSGIADSTGLYLQGLSKFKISAAFTGAYGSTMRSYSLAITGMGTYSDMDTTTGVIPVSGSVTLKATVTDSRGNTGTASVTVDVTAYTPPHLTAIKVERSDTAGNVQQDGPCGKITFSAEVTSLGGNNTAAYAYCYRLKGSTDWTETELPGLANQLIVTDQICIFTASIDYSYEVAIRITDKFTATLSTVIPMSSAFILGQVTEDGTGMSFGCRATRSNTIEYGIAAMFDADVTGTALGLAGLPLIPAGSDLNYYTSPGAYSGANANFVNCPSSSAGVLIVSYALGFLSPSALGIRQVYLPADNSAIYIRILTQTNGSWTYGEWKQITLTAVAVG